ncbi:MAG: hypothetical protein ACREML_03200 [Vulcanimicrobiaceae bacterium]
MAWRFIPYAWYRRKMLMASASYNIRLMPWLIEMPRFLLVQQA